MSVIVATRDRSAMLAAAVASVRAQTLAAIEILIVDDGSTDDTPALCATLVAAEPRLRVIRHAVPRERCAARNAGLAAARAERIAFLDDDDLLVPDGLAALLEAARRDGAPVLAGLAEQFDSPDATLTPTDVLADPGRFRLRPWLTGPPTELNLAGLLLAPLAPINAGLFSSAWMRELGGFDERRTAAEDYEVWLKAARSSSIPVLRRTVALVRRHGGQTTASLGRMARETRAVLTDFLHAHPEARGQVTSRALRRRLAVLAIEEAYAALIEGDRAAAARSAAAAVRHCPGLPKAWFYLAAAPVPRVWDRLRRAVRSARLDGEGRVEAARDPQPLGHDREKGGGGQRG